MTAWRRASEGRIEGAFQNDAGRWMVEIDDPQTETVAYARVSSHDQKHDLDRQIARIAEWAATNDIKIDRYVREIGSGLNDRRKQLNKLLRDPRCRRIVVEHRERLGRFGVHELENALAASDRDLLIIEDKEIDDDLVRDMIDVMTSLAARLYGRRSARHRAERAVKAMDGET
jgi:putative resolvase